MPREQTREQLQQQARQYVQDGWNHMLAVGLRLDTVAEVSGQIARLEGVLLTLNHLRALLVVAAARPCDYCEEAKARAYHQRHPEDLNLYMCDGCAEQAAGR